MYEIGTEVRYHGSIEFLRGETFTVLRHCCEGTRYVLEGSERLRHVRAASITPLDVADIVVDFRPALERAIAAAQPVMITYIAVDGEWTTRTVEPYALERTKAGHMIVRVLDRRSGKPRSFRLDRIHALDAFPGGCFLLGDSDHQERAALARIRAEIDLVDHHGYRDAARWLPEFAQ